ncbi:MAG: hypothetical protein PHP46_05380, partial [Candidatus Omnitrophica bacterium]|nr:hypothetical protein [Candidatus Omnitrophota bacterium]
PKKAEAPPVLNFKEKRPEPKSVMVTIHLNSGGVFTGEIVREDKKEIELKLSFETGQGSIVIKKSDIKNIKR